LTGGEGYDKLESMNKRNFIKGLVSVGLLTDVGVGSEVMVEKTLKGKIEEIYRKNGWAFVRSVGDAPVGLYSMKKGRCVGVDEIDGSWDVERQCYAHPAKGYDGGDIVIWEAGTFRYKNLGKIEERLLSPHHQYSPLVKKVFIMHGEAYMMDGVIVYRGAHLANAWGGNGCME
jgi:hypothetical protein